ncbi:glycerophosphodiester phosphodiesterase family protein [Sphingomonas sp. Leaf4]|uniref:glycerophosphodiester phosphodiesterase family protein n=1 Tax=Sphingomonas sp. Leaf4 TaxID=2876553 RepID=UPI001E32AB9E|nr:glycerophosphodiester phosphodiesterase family protein [Sphingomonas sp. Leaf4]
MRMLISASALLTIFASGTALADPVLPVVPSPYLVSKITEKMFEAPSRTSDLVLLSAHRGYWEVYPENSAYALQEAWNREYETVEVDARFTSDKQIIVSHDFNIDRESTGSGAVNELTFAQIAQANLRDRHGREFKDSQGRAAKFLTFSQALDLLVPYLTTDGHGYVMIVDVKKTPGSASLDILQKCLDIIASKNNPLLSKAVVLKIKAKDAGDLGTFLNQTTYDPNVNGGLILVENPEDQNVRDANYDPHQDVNYTQWNAAPFPIQFEMNQFYKGDGLEKYFNYSDQNKGFATYHESNFYPEGVATSAGGCCVAHDTDPRSGATGGIIPDYRGDPEMAIINRSNLITTDWVDVVGEMLRELGRRNTDALKQ